MSVFFMHRAAPKIGLPKKYLRLNYIESSGTQYINLGYIPNVNTEVQALIDFFSSNSTYNCIFGVGQTTTNQFVVYRTNSSTMTGQLYSTKTYNTSGVALIGLNKVKLSNSKFSYGTYSVDCTNETFTYTYPMTIFCMNSVGSPTLHANMRLYSFDIYEQHKLVHSYVPCKNSSNIIGLYDVIGRRFYNNAGSGVFTGG